MNFTIEGNIVDAPARRIFGGRVVVENGRIAAVEETGGVYDRYILPPFVDSHIHIESTMLLPSRFAAEAVRHGVAAAMADPHEIANVMGMQGVRYMLDDAGRVPFRFFFGAPSCVPASPLDPSGEVIGVEDIEALLQDDRIWFLAEMMNFPGVVHGDAQVMRKIAAAQRAGKPVDGHAPGLRGDGLRRYVAAGISTDHETATLEEAEEKLSLGMKILIREGSAAKDFEALWSLIDRFPGQVMVCSDDMHPDDLVAGYMDGVFRRALDKGVDLFNLVTAFSHTPVEHYGVPVGLLRVEDPADFIVAGDLRDFWVGQTYIGGVKVFDREAGALFALPDAVAVNRFEAGRIVPGALKVPRTGTRIRVIEAADGELYTGSGVADVAGETVEADVSRDILKLVLVDRYDAKAAPVVGFVRGFGLKRGALAVSVAHDSHHILAVGCSDRAIAAALNAVIDARGGLAAADEADVEMLPLPVAGLMGMDGARQTALRYEALQRKAAEMGSALSSPFITLSFMALTVIPELKLSAGGLFDVGSFSHTSLFI